MLHTPSDKIYTQHTHPHTQFFMCDKFLHRLKPEKLTRCGEENFRVRSLQKNLDPSFYVRHRPSVANRERGGGGEGGGSWGGRAKWRCIVKLLTYLLAIALVRSRLLYAWTCQHSERFEKLVVPHCLHIRILYYICIKLKVLSQQSTLFLHI